MHVVVSTSLQTWNSRLTSTPGAAPTCPEILIISVEAWLIVRSLCLLDFHEEAFGFGSMRVGIGNSGRQQIGRRPGISSFVFVNPAEALMDGQTNLVDLFAVNHHGLQATRDER